MTKEMDLIPDREKRSFSSPKYLDQLWAYPLTCSMGNGHNSLSRSGEARACT